MKSLIVLAVLASTSAFAGVQGHVHFQADSTWVNAYYSKSLCLDGDMYRAVVTKCLEYGRGDDRPCLKRGKVAISQPMYSTRLRCANYQGDECQSYERVSYTQSPNITVKFTNNEGQVTGTKDITVPSCN